MTWMQSVFKPVTGGTETCEIYVKGVWGVAGTVTTEMCQQVSAKCTGRKNIFLSLTFC